MIGAYRNLGEALAARASCPPVHWCHACDVRWMQDNGACWSCGGAEHEDISANKALGGWSNPSTYRLEDR